MAQKTLSVSIKGIAPLLMHAYPMVTIEALEKKSQDEQAALAAYKTEEGMLYIPGINLQRALVAGAAYVKGKGRASLQKPVAAAVFVSPERLSLGTSIYAIDARAVVIPATKGRVVRYRPRLDDWQVTFMLEFDSDLLTEKQLRYVVDNTGKNVGLLDFRPEKKGPMGRFMVVTWK